MPWLVSADCDLINRGRGREGLEERNRSEELPKRKTDVKGVKRENVEGMFVWRWWCC